MPVRSCFLINWVSQFQILLNGIRSKIENLLNFFGNFPIVEVYF